jgi:mono/diheme cytochrome c family protein
MRRWFSIALVWPAAAFADPGGEFFESKVRPLLVEHCYECHSAEKTKGDLALDTKAGWEKGGKSGTTIVVGKPDESLLIKAVRYHDEDLAMPPQKKGGKLPDSAIATLTEWVKMGAPDPRVAVVKIGGMKADEAKTWWAFQPLPHCLTMRPASPKSGASSSKENPPPPKCSARNSFLPSTPLTTPKNGPRRRACSWRAVSFCMWIEP